MALMSTALILNMINTDLLNRVIIQERLLTFD
nr:MAG TPA: hypothetical protein [Caudoviricetes sp.]